MGTNELTGGASSYYSLAITKPTKPYSLGYITECNDIIEALELNFAEGNVLKALWRIGKIRQGQGKSGTTALYDAEKVKFFGDRILEQNS